MAQGYADEKRALRNAFDDDDSDVSRQTLITDLNRSQTIDSEARQAARNVRRGRRIISFTCCAVIIALWLTSNFSELREALRVAAPRNSTPTADVAGGASPFDWSTIHPHKDLKWTGCYDDFECARLEVPLDYADPSGEKAAIAVIKLAALVPSTDAHHKGPILFNPGGPAGSGVGLIVGAGKVLQTVVGPNFDLVSFDPRGSVGFTTPSLTVFSNENAAGQFYIDYPYNVNVSDTSMGNSYAYSQILGKIANEKAGKVAQFVSTPNTATDMLGISRAMGHDKLQYWGFSYGTVLGATFAAMFPDNVGRLIIDGVVDSDNYYSGGWSNNLLDTDNALLDIFDACVAAGPHKCKLHENSTELVSKRVDALLNSLKTKPIPVYVSAPVPVHGVVGYQDVKGIIFGVLYNTHNAGQALTDLLAELEQGNGTTAYLMSTGRLFEGLLTCNCPAPGQPSNSFPGLFYEHLLSIACGDSPLENESFDDMKATYEDMAEISTFSELWWIHAGCSGWTVKGKHRFDGSFEQARNTSHPLLLIGNTADPVTPLWAAHKMSKGFNGSVVLTQNSSGHCSISALSMCTLRHIREYFESGALPDKGTVCETDSQIFGKDELWEYNTSTLSADDLQLLEAAHTLVHEKYFVPIVTQPFSV